jgi:hypothetical protein
MRLARGILSESAIKVLDRFAEGSSRAKPNDALLTHQSPRASNTDDFNVLPEYLSGDMCLADSLFYLPH